MVKHLKSVSKADSSWIFGAVGTLTKAKSNLRIRTDMITNTHDLTIWNSRSWNEVKSSNFKLWMVELRRILTLIYRSVDEIIVENEENTQNIFFKLMILTCRLG